MIARVQFPAEPAPVQGPCEPVAYYGARLFAYVIATGNAHGLSDLQLSQAIAAGVAASCTPNLSPAVADRYSRVRHDLYTLERIRQRLTTAPAQAPATAPAERPNLGPMAPLSRAPIVRPPAGYATTAPTGARRDDIPF